MGTLLVKNAAVLVTMDDYRREIKDGGLFVRDGIIEAVGSEADLPGEADEVVNASDCVVLPGLINTHHHFYQNLTRTVPAAQNATLFQWLKTLYPIWARMGPEEIQCATQLALSEMALAGTTCASDHLYLFPNGARLDDEIEAAEEIGLRLHATRGAMSIGESNGGLPPDQLVESESHILDDSLRLIQAYHDPRPGAMIRIGIAPCSPFSVSRELMRDAALLARDQKVMLHTHLAENEQDVEYSLSRFGCRPGDYSEELGWVGDDVWHAHCVKLNEREIKLFAQTNTGVAHCPCSNMRLGSGIAPIREMLKNQVNVGLGVDGAASNDSSDLMGEVRQVLLMQRAIHGSHILSARDALEMATIGGAKVLGREDLGALEIGKRADFAVFPVDEISLSGAWDKVAALVFCSPIRSLHTVVEGRFVVRDGRLTNPSLPKILNRHKNLTNQLINRS